MTWQLGVVLSRTQITQCTFKNTRFPCVAAVSFSLTLQLQQNYSIKLACTLVWTAKLAADNIIYNALYYFTILLLLSFAMKHTLKRASHHQPNISATFPHVPTGNVRGCRRSELISRCKLTVSTCSLSCGVSCAVGVRSQSHISWFLLSLTSGGTRSAVGAVWRDRRAARSEARTHSGQA